MKANLDDHILHLKHVFSEHAEFYPRLRDEVEWQIKQWRNRPLPRLCKHSVQQTPVGATIVRWLEVFCHNNLGVRVRVHDVFGNYYRTGTDYLPQHRDAYSTPEMPIHVISISFGASRRFTFQEGSTVAASMMLESGDVIIFDPYMNQNYTHGIAKTSSLKEGRINLTCFVSFDSLPYGKKCEGDIAGASEIAAQDMMLM